MIPAKQKETFVPIHLYIEDFYEPISKGKKQSKDDEEESDRGVVIIEIM